MINVFKETWQVIITPWWKYGGKRSDYLWGDLINK